jgi:hypothetical protein
MRTKTMTIQRRRLSGNDYPDEGAVRGDNDEGKKT